MCCWYLQNTLKASLRLLLRIARNLPICPHCSNNSNYACQTYQSFFTAKNYSTLCISYCFRTIPLVPTYSRLFQLCVSDYIVDVATYGQLVNLTNALVVSILIIPKIIMCARRRYSYFPQAEFLYRQTGETGLLALI